MLQKQATAKTADGAEYGFGWLRDHPDPRDWLYAAPTAILTEALPAHVSLRAKMPPIFDQGQLGSCTANATAAAVEYAEHRQGQRPMRLSRLELYYQGRKAINTVKEDSGAQIRDVVKATAVHGVAAERLWPYNIGRFAEQPPASLGSSDRFHRTLEYRAVPRSVATMRACLAEGFPFVFGFPVYESFMDVGPSGVWAPKPSEQIIGYHAVAAIGADYRQPIAQWEIRNSWSEQWGDEGHFHVTEAFILQYAFDLWTIRRST